jgi:DNA-entry nuclease
MKKRQKRKLVKYLLLLFIGSGMYLSQQPSKVDQIKDFAVQTGKTWKTPSHPEETDQHPNFTEEELDLSKGYWQTFSSLDHLNRVGVANAMLHKDFMPSEERGDISNVYPTGWKQKKLKDGKWLYNRSHLIGFQLTGENDNWLNLFTGTQELNQVEMVRYENEIADYLRTTDNHVRYRVTPIFHDQELLARAVTLDAQSVEDNTISIHVTIENTQPGVTIDYSTGAARLEETNREKE